MWICTLVLLVGGNPGTLSALLRELLHSLRAYERPGSSRRALLRLDS